MSKIEFIGDKVSVPALFGQILEREGLEAVVVLVRITGCWTACWSDGVTVAGISMAALKLMGDAQNYIHGEKRSGWSSQEEAPPD
jgi:hypothetical protein